MKKHSERRSGGINALRTLAGGSFDPERAARAMVRRHGALGTYGVDHVLGNLWNRPNLTRRDRSLIVVTFLTTIGATDELAFHIEGALNHGLTRAEVEEIVLQVAGYAGFPMAMAASRIVDQVWCKLDGIERQPARDEAECLDDDERWRRANAVRSVMWGGRNAEDPEADRDAIVEYLGGVGEQAFDFAFGELWARDALSKRDRSLVTVAILAISRCTDELKIHLRVGLNHGCTRAELEEVMVQLTGYGGFPKAVEGFRTARALFAKLDERKAST